MKNELKIHRKPMEHPMKNDDVSDAANDNNGNESHDNDSNDFLVVGGCACLGFT